MTSQETPPTAQVIGNAFVQQYYLILHKSPELVHRFYQDISKLGRPEANNEMASVTSLVAINEKILSMDLMKAEIKSVDAQDSLNGGVIVLVTGEITAHDKITREFTQTFFLAPQEKGYFVLNDLFRYTAAGGIKIQTDDSEHGFELGNGVASPVQPEHDQGEILQVTEREMMEEVTIEEDQVYSHSSNEDDLVVEEETPVPEVIDEVPIVESNNNIAPLPVSSPVVAASSSVSSPPEDAPKKSYASIVKVMRSAPVPAPAPAPVTRSAPAPVARSALPPKQEKQVAAAPAPVQVPPTTETPAFSSNASDNTTPVQELDDGHSVYVRNLPLNATPQQLEDEFAKFGTIRQGGIQVRSHKQQGFCYGFVEFEDASSVQNAIAASPVTLAGRQCYVEEKRASGPRGGGGGGGNRGRFSGGRGGNERSGSFRNEGPRSGRGGGGGGGGPRGGYGRDFNNFRGSRGGPSGGPGPRGPRSPAASNPAAAPAPAPAPADTNSK